MWLMNWIVEQFYNAGNLFYGIYLEVLGWVWPFWWVADFFYTLSGSFYSLAWSFAELAVWLDSLAARVQQALTWDNAWNLILSHIPNLVEISSWFYYWYFNILNVVSEWWYSTQWIVLAWVDEAKNFANTLFSQVNSAVVLLQASWDSFKGMIPVIEEVVSWWGNWSGFVNQAINTWWTSAMGEVQGLINSAFIEREPFWAGWQDWRDKVTEFFTDPEEWLYKAVDRIIERFW